MNDLTPTEFVALVNQTLEYAYSSVTVVGEVASFKVNQGKWAFFDLKDEETSVPCFMTAWSIRQPIEDGMKVVVRGAPKLTKWGKFSLSVNQVQPVGEGSLKKAFEMLKKKLKDEGLFDAARKRGIPEDLTRLGVISSVQAAGYADFVKIINARWGGMKVQVAHTQVQGIDAPDQIMRALKYFNERGEVQMIAILRGGGSADDLACFNDEQLARAVAASKIPVITGIGHEVDESLVDLVADVRASTPSNAAEMLTRDKKTEILRTQGLIKRAKQKILQDILYAVDKMQRSMVETHRHIEREFEVRLSYIKQKIMMLEALNPEAILKKGYAILSGKVSPGNVVKITTFDAEIMASVQEVLERSKK